VVCALFSSGALSGEKDLMQESPPSLYFVFAFIGINSYNE